MKTVLSIALAFIVSGAARTALAGSCQPTAAERTRAEERIAAAQTAAGSGHGANSLLARVRQAASQCNISTGTISYSDVTSAVNDTSVAPFDCLQQKSAGNADCAAGGCQGYTAPSESGEGQFLIALDTKAMANAESGYAEGLAIHEFMHVLLSRKGITDMEQQHRIICAMGLGGGAHHGRDIDGVNCNVPLSRRGGSCIGVERVAGANPGADSGAVTFEDDVMVVSTTRGRRGSREGKQKSGGAH